MPTADVIIVVDPCELDYRALVVAGEAGGIRLTFLSSGEQALLWPSNLRVLAWMIALQLPDMTGLELQLLLRPRLARALVIMVDDQYDATREVSVLAAGRPFYASKPLDGSWVEKLRSHPRAGNTNRVDSRENLLGDDNRVFQDEFKRLSAED